MSDRLQDIFGNQFVHRQRPVRRIGVMAQDVQRADPSKVITHSETGYLGLPIAMRPPGSSKRVTPATDVDAGDNPFFVQVPGQPTAYFSNRERAEAYYWREHDRIAARQKEIERRKNEAKERVSNGYR